MTDSTDGDTAPTPDPQPALEQAAEQEIEDFRRALEEREAQYLRLAADFENFRRRTAQEHGDRTRYASEAAALALIPVLDNLQRAMSHAAEGDPLLDGVRMVARQ